MSIEMYRIREVNIRIKVVCEICESNGIVISDCFKCGGKGIHNKTITLWKVSPRTVTISYIDRASKDDYYKGVQTSYEGELRYWLDMSEFYNERDRLLHFTKKDAQRECDKRNKAILDNLCLSEKARFEVCAKLDHK